MSTHAARRAPGPVRRFIKRNLAHVVGWFVVIFAVGAVGVTQALPGSNTVTSDDIVNGQVKTADIAVNAVDSSRVKNGSISSFDIKNGTIRGLDLKNNAVTSAKVKDETLVGADVLDESLSGADILDGSVGGADLANNSVSGAKVQNNSLTGSDINEGTLNFGCGQPGLANAWAYIDGDAGFTNGVWYNSSTGFIDAAWNCANSTANGVQVRKNGTGNYTVFFANIGGPLVITGNVEYSGGDCYRSNMVFNRNGSQQFQVYIRDHNGNAENCEFSFLIH